MHSSKLSILVILATTISCAWTLKCYHCNSVTDENCGDPFDAPSADTYLKDCSTVASSSDEGTYYCRKTTQKTSLRGMKDESVRVIRTCGFKNDTRLFPDEGESPKDLKCYRRAGTFETESLYCGCYEDACNPAPRPVPNVLHSAGIILVSGFFARMLY